MAKNKKNVKDEKKSCCKICGFIKNHTIPVITAIITAIVALVVVLVAVNVGNGEPADDATLADFKTYNSQLIFVMSDGTEIDAGKLPDNHEGIKIISATRSKEVMAGSSGHKEKITIVCRGSNNAEYTIVWNIPKFGEGYSLKGAYINNDGELVFKVKDNGEIKYVTQGKLLKLSTPKEELTPSGASEYANGALPADYAEVEIKVKGYGTITVLLDKTAAPKTVSAFLELVEDGYYDGLTFNKIMDAQKYGDAASYILGGISKESAPEIKDTEYSSGISHKYGTISMYHADGKNATSQFFICTADSTELDGKYSAFGYVTSGMNIVLEIANLTSLFSEPDGVLEKDLATYRAKQAVIESITVKK